jgi:orotate phosphoribosyltransferase
LDAQSDLNRLQDLLLRKSVKFGHFVLHSGQTSDVYVDCKPTTCDAAAMPAIGRLVLQKIRARDWNPEAVGGLMVGAEPIAFAVARESLELPPQVDAFIVRKEAKSHGTQKLVEGIDPTEGRKVVVIDDVCSKGDSTAVAVRNMQSVGMQVLGAICLVDREMGASDLLRREFGLELESIFKLSQLRANSGSVLATVR